MKLNQKGITLVELIAALALVSLIGVIAWTALSIGMQHGSVETSKTRMQQDANIIISTLMNAHRKSDTYNLTFSGNKLNIESCKDGGTCTVEVIEKEYNFSGTKINSSEVGTDATSTYAITGLKPKEAHTEVILKITDINNPNRTLLINTKLTRMLTN